MTTEHKRLISVAGGALIALALVACGSSNNNAKSNAASNAATQAAPASAAASSATAAATTAAVNAASGTAAAVASASATKAASPTAAAAKIRRGGTLNVASELNPKTFDPMLSNDVYSGYVTAQVFDGLVKFDPDIKPVPWLADSWDISADGKEYTFHLHKGVKFHDGTDFNAAAMKFSMDRIRNNKASVGQSDCGTKTVVDTQVIDDLTFKVILVDPYAPFLTKLTGRCGAAVSPTAVQKQGDDDFGLHPVGTGPFKFLEFKTDDHMTVVKNENYWKMGADGKPLPYLDKINWRVITDENTRLQALLTGELDTSSVADKDVDTVKQTPDLVFKQQTGFGWGGFMLNVSKPPFDNKALAQAVQYAIDRDEFVRVINKNLREKAVAGVIPPPLKFAVDPTQKFYDYDPAKAKAKLAEGGQPNGFSFTILADTSSPVTQQSLELYQAQLKKVGIDMKIESGDFNSVVVKRALAGDFEATGITISGGIDPDSWIYSTFHSDPGNPISAFNIPHLNDPAIDKLAEQGRQESDINKRAEIYKQANKLIMDHSPWVMVNYSADRFVGNKKVQGWHLGVYPTQGYAEYWKTSD
ncbi:MAG: ABC transporter substrate-binding protein [Dehalococcoidia bacterium]